MPHPLCDKQQSKITVVRQAATASEVFSKSHGIHEGWQGEIEMHTQVLLRSRRADGNLLTDMV